MTRLGGQAAYRLWTILHRACAAALALLVVAVAAGAVLAWRLSEGPINIPWIGARLAAAFNQDIPRGRLEIGSSALAWEGFRNGLGAPVDIRLGDVSLRDARGTTRLAIPRLRVTLSLAGLLAGRIEPREVILEQPNVIAERSADGRLRLIGGATLASASAAGADLGAGAAAAVAMLARPSPVPSGGSAELSRLRRVRIDHAGLRLIDHRLGVTWQARRVDIDLQRDKLGGVQGHIALVLTAGEHRVPLSGTIESPPGGTETSLRLRLPPLVPAQWAGVTPALAPLAALDMPVGGEALVTLGPHLAIGSLRLAIQAGAGTAHIAEGTLPIERAEIVASGTPQRMQLETARLVLPGLPGTPASTVDVSGTLQRDRGRIEASLEVGIDAVAFAALPQLWPAGIGGGARSWVLQNVTAGRAHDGNFDVTLTAAEDGSDLTLTRAGGTLDADGLTVNWLRPVPPVVQGRAELRLVDPDTLEITVPSAQSAPETPGGEGLAVRGLLLHVTGLLHNEQTATITADLSGSVAAAIALLRDPRLHLLSRHKLPLRHPAGQVDAGLTVSLPLDADVTIDQVAIAVRAHLSGVHLGAVVADHDLDQGMLDLTADNNGLSLAGTARLADIPVQLQAAMDFRAGPPDAVVRRIGVSGRPDARQLAAAGLDAGGLLAGPVPLSAELTERRNGAATVAVHADLTPATLSVDALAWRKPEGRAASATATLLLDHDRLRRIAPIRIQGEGLDVNGDAEFVQGRLTTLNLNRLQLGRTTAQASVRFPPAVGPISASLSGAVLDLSGRFGSRAGSNGARPAAETAPGPPWTADAKFDQVMMAGGETLTDLTAHAEDDGLVVRTLRLDGLLPKRASLRVAIQSDGPRRTLTASAADAGALLRAVDATDAMEAGRLAISATYDDDAAGHPLAGTAEIDDFSVRNAPVIGKLLQAVTLYGLVEALRGPGLGFSKLVAPFHWHQGVLTLDDARAFSPSLGLTGKGDFDLNSQRVDLAGTIVPAYFFNSLLGRMPIIGRLFSPERGGGVIAGSYSLRGPIDNPSVVVNPLTALTPGFLRGLFKLF